MTTEDDTSKLDAAIKEVERILRDFPLENEPDRSADTTAGDEDLPKSVNTFNDESTWTPDFGDSALDYNVGPDDQDGRYGSPFGMGYGQGGLTHQEALLAIKSIMEAISMSVTPVNNLIGARATADLLTDLGNEYTRLYNEYLARNADRYVRLSGTLRNQIGTLRALHSKAKQTASGLRDVAKLLDGLSSLMAAL